MKRASHGPLTASRPAAAQDRPVPTDSGSLGRGRREAETPALLELGLHVHAAPALPRSRMAAGAGSRLPLPTCLETGLVPPSARSLSPSF